MLTVVNKWRLRQKGSAPGSVPGVASAARFASSVAALAALFLVAVGVGWFAHAAPQGSLVTVSDEPAKTGSTAGGPTILPAVQGDQCVADTAVMRKDHMDLLNHQRDETVIQGIRDNPFSLVACVNCHAHSTAEGTPIRIDAEGQFCQSCHAYAAVSIDCFSCHAAVPEQPPEQAESVQLQNQSAFWSPGQTPELGHVYATEHRQLRSMLAVASTHSSASAHAPDKKVGVLSNDKTLWVSEPLNPAADPGR